MLYGFYYSTLRTVRMGSLVPFYHSATIEVTVADVYASTSIFGLSTGMLSGTPGFGTSYIKQYGKRRPDGVIDHVIHSSEDFVGAIYIPQCAFIEFRVAAVQADVSGHITVLVLSSSTDAPAQKRKMEAIDFQHQGKTLATHDFSLLEQGSRVTTDPIIQQAKLDLANEQRLNPSDIQIVRRKLDSDLVKFVPGNS